MKYTDKVIKIGRVKTVIFDQDCITHIPNLKHIYFNRQNPLNTKEERFEFNNKFPKDITYSISNGQKVSKAFLKEWKEMENVSCVKSISPNGENEIYRYTYNM
jgi:hypothetical protein